MAIYDNKSYRAVIWHITKKICYTAYFFLHTKEQQENSPAALSKGFIPSIIQ